MTSYLTFVIGLFIGGILVWFLRFRGKKSQRRRDIAGAFVGEIVGVLREVEVEKLAELLERRCSEDDIELENALPEFHLPPFTVYEANIKRLGLLPAPLPREIANFYTQLSTLKEEFVELSSGTIAMAIPQERKERERCVLLELKETLDLGDDILRELRPFISVRR